MRLSQGCKYFFGVSLAALLFTMPIAPCLAQTPSIDATREAAEQGDTYAQTTLGLMYQFGQGVPQDYTEAMMWFQKAAKEGNAGAQYQLGLIRKAAEQGYPGAQYQLGVMYRYQYQFGQGVSQDYTEAAKWFQKAAAQGDAGAQRDLGLMFSNGNNYTEAAKWYRKAAEQGDAYSQETLGSMYKEGQGVPLNYTEAAKWYYKAAEQGEVGAQYQLGLLYKKGQGVPIDYVEAYKWASIAAAHKVEFLDEIVALSAQLTLDKLERLMTPQQVSEAQAQAQEWKPKPEK